MTKKISRAYILQKIGKEVGEKANQKNRNSFVRKSQENREKEKKNVENYCTKRRK